MNCYLNYKLNQIKSLIDNSVNLEVDVEKIKQINVDIQLMMSYYKKQIQAKIETTSMNQETINNLKISINNFLEKYHKEKNE